jgi:alkane 1-monooxygenase
MIVLAIVPAVWRRVMDPRVLAHFGGDITRANISPRNRDRVLAAYGAGDGAEGPERASRGLAAAAAGDFSDDDTGRPTRRPSSEGPSDPSPTPDEPLVWKCPGCSYVYDVVAGDEREGFAAGTAWSEIPDSWCCPDCGVREKVDFVPAEPAVTG